MHVPNSPPLKQSNWARKVLPRMPHSYFSNTICHRLGHRHVDEIQTSTTYRRSLLQNEEARRVHLRSDDQRLPPQRTTTSMSSTVPHSSRTTNADRRIDLDVNGGRMFTAGYPIDMSKCCGSASNASQGKYSSEDGDGQYVGGYFPLDIRRVLTGD